MFIAGGANPRVQVDKAKGGLAEKRQLVDDVLIDNHQPPSALRESHILGLISQVMSQLG